ncbi:M15 family metallopeptidase [Tsukamurella pseudospumae]|uniref:M15 family metallopeptidase n=1 Tax=Tsukamurella pseudospumae TaxID=239498 RepID=UPI00083927C1|nr:M15 family metallopeptidase [Tsukamurella pseudospumae]
MAHVFTKSTAALVIVMTVAACSETLPGIPDGTGAGTVGPLGEADGVVADHVAVDADVPAVTNLDPRLRQAVRKAALAAEREGVSTYLTSGWRSQRYQRFLYDEAVRRDGAQEAARLVASPTDSEHVTGDAVDIGPDEAARWMSRNGERYGLCRIYENEIWHYERRSGRMCPDLVADASERQR